MSISLSHTDLDVLRSRLSLRDLAEQAGARFHGLASNPSSPCPLHHGDNPTAFHLYANGARWHCFTRCPSGRNDGDLISFYMLWKNVSFHTALAELSSFTPLHERSQWGGAGGGVLPNVQPTTFNLQPNPQWQSRAHSFIAYARDQLNHSKTGAPARAYLLTARRLQPSTWDTFNLGYNPTDLFDNPISWGISSSPSLQGRGRGLGRVFIPRGLVIPGLLNALPHYIKIRRPMPNDSLSSYLPALNVQPSTCNFQRSKFLSLRGSHPLLFGQDAFTNHSTLLLTEGEWDCMLAWQSASDLLDVATLGSASNRASFPSLAALTRYPRILAVYDADPAGDRARQYLHSFERVIIIPPPAHDLTDYLIQGGNLKLWLYSNLE